ncbi:Protein kinase, ATP binding site-containing protein, partial [Cynara cardunculus var. scolymus]
SCDSPILRDSPDEIRDDHGSSSTVSSDSLPIGQGTYSNVYRARELQTGRMMALKKVRFDNFQPESVRFMAREIKILRRLDHPNVMKLEGIITSRLSCSIYLLLKGIEHCHSRGVIHRDIKSSNILINNEGVLKIADFGLANFFNSRSKQPLTSRVVTLWYRPPELLLGSTNYGPYVDMWSVGCVFAELFVGRPILKGRTEVRTFRMPIVYLERMHSKRHLVEQLHKIFKLCGTPPDEYWTKSKLPLAAMFRPQFTYASTLRERCKELPRTVVDLIDTLISVEPEKRATAKSALQAEYFYTRPYACDPASMPKYSPNKEIDARVQASGTSRNPRRSRRTLQEQSSFSKLIPEDGNRNFTRDFVDSKASYDTVSEVSQMTETSQADSICTLPAQATTSNGSGPSGARRTHRRHVVQMHHNFIKFETFDASGVYEPEDISSGNPLALDANRSSKAAMDSQARTEQ